MRRRLDAELVRRGLVGSRAEASEAIAAGRVMVAGRPAGKASTLVAAEEPLDLHGETSSFVSRGGEKLSAALDDFEIDVVGRECLDAGASTGGFTDCLLRRGAAHVTALDVGYGQLAWSLRTDERVTVLERTNVRDLRADRLPRTPTLVVADLSFISLRLALPSLAKVADAAADFVLLVKPQFEAGRGQVGKGGVVRDPDVWRQVVADVAASCATLGIGPKAVTVSQLLGPAGNVEFFFHGVAGAKARELDLDTLIQRAEALRVAS
jgi:23S rRNA (cytidine1920-2'-O)/16S rRNA (cytidine1409-2'-O)-methyltransferase